MAKFWDWISPEAETDNAAVLVLSGVIDSGTSWLEDSVTPAMLRAELERYADRHVRVEINSPGGDVFAGFEIYNMLRARGNISVRVTGMAASAASIVALSADPGKLGMCALSMMVIHNPWATVCGEAKDLQQQAQVLGEIREMMINAYMTRYAGTREELAAMLDQETYLSPARAMEMGLCDCVETIGGDSVQSVDAAIAGRYAALTGQQVRAWHSRMARLPPMTASAAPEKAGKRRDYLAEVDAILASLDKGALAPAHIHIDAAQRAEK